MLNEAQQGAIELLYKEMFESLFVYALNSINDRALAEEAVQDTFRIACAKPEALLFSENPPGWLMNVLKYVLSNMRRRRARMAALFVDTMSANIESLSHGDDAENSPFLYLDKISQEDYELLRMTAIEGMSMLEISNQLGISIDACRKRVQRLRKKLKKFFD